MDDEASVEAVHDGGVLHVRALGRAVHVEVKGIAPEPLALAHVLERDALYANRAPFHDHRVATESTLDRGSITLHDDVSGQEADLGALVDRVLSEVLDRAPVLVLERFVEVVGVSLDRGDRALLIMDAPVVRRRDDDPVPGVLPPGRSGAPIIGICRGFLKAPGRFTS
ncbi:MAG: hypothetical protein JJE05_12395 [Actinobacteria bacterium]|nr:hypothetical protein [Actinomycetota bacterium]